jgi:lipopolysaccharide export system protein LptA
MKTPAVLLLLLTLGWGGALLAQTSSNPPPSSEAVSKSPVRVKYPLSYRQKAYRMREVDRVLEQQFSCETWPGTDEDRLMTPFQMLAFKSGPSNELQLIAESPQCHFDNTDHRGWDSGPIVLFTPTTNLWVQGVGFLFIETNHWLYISNKVETRLVRSLLKSAMLNGPKTNAPAAPTAPGQLLKIFADGPAIFDNQSNLVRYFHHVHVIDVQLDMTSERLSIQFTTNGAVQTILAEDNVVMTTTNKGWATGPRAFYYITNGNEMTEMTGDAVWHNGDQQAKAQKFLYNSTSHLLTAIGDVHVWWPNAPQQPGVVPKVDTNGFRILHSDFATLQMPATNGPVEAMHAEGNVLIVNQKDNSSSTSDQADYVRTNNLFVLTGGLPVWWNERMEIKGPTLRADATNQVYHARGGSKFKLKVASTSRTNQVLYIDSDSIDYATNLAVFTDHVHTRLLEDDVLRDTLDSDQLDVELVSNEVKTATARGHVQGETAPDKFGRIKTVDCDTLIAHHNPVTKLMQDVFAEGSVVLRQFSTNKDEARNQLTSDAASVFFSAVTNQVERAVAERDVVIDQIKTNGVLHATGERMVYTAAADEAKLTGSPVARTDHYVISNSDYLIWQPKTNRFRAFGPYNILPVKAKVEAPTS